MTGERWKASFFGFLASTFSVAVVVHVYMVFAIKADTGVFERGLIGVEALKIYVFEVFAVAMMILPMWLAIALYSERNAKRGAGWHIATPALGAALIMLALFFATYDAQYYAQTGRLFAAIVTFPASIVAGAIGGFMYWLTAGKNAGSTSQ